MMNWAKYLKKGLIKEQKSNFKQIGKQIIRAEKDLSTFSLVIDADPEWASTIAYQAMLRAGRALLYSFGFLPADGQQHKTVVKITGEILGEKYTTTVKKFDKYRKKRNNFFYDSEDAHNFTEAKIALKTAKELLKEIKKRIKSSNPQMIFDW